ncbi:MAG: DUF354 domain-containing protein [Chlorobi bacterium]|nr:DUF354 domain-containing protein [Chlorobiota bacterium]
MIDIGHPAHVHYFRNMINILTKEGCEFLVFARNRQYVFELLDAYGIKYIDRGSGSDRIAGKIVYLIKASLKIYNYARRFKPDLFLDFGTMYSCFSGFVLRKKHVVFEDTENAGIYRMLYKPLVDVIYTSESFEVDLGRKHKRFKSYMELAYLHKKYFNPDDSVLKTAGIKRGEPFSIVRFVNWKAVHDFGKRGLTAENKKKIIKALEKYGKVFVLSEMELPAELKSYHLSVEPDKLHSLMYYASLVLGESATMASEAAMLGVPSVFIDKTGRGYTNELEKKYGTLLNFSPDDNISEIIRKAVGLFNEEKKTAALSAAEKIQSENIDLTGFMVNIIKAEGNIL